MAAAVMSASAQTTYNYFDPADCDADGWLWFDTQEKIDKYVRYYSSKQIGSNAPRIYLLSSTFENENGEWAEPYADPDVQGYNAEGVEGGEGSKTGAIVLSPGSSSMGTITPDGGAFLLWLPDCAQFDLCISQELDRIQPGIFGGMDWIADIDCNVIRTYVSMGFFGQPYSKTFDCTWTNIQAIENTNTDVSCHSIGQPAGQKVTAVFRQNCNCDMLIHGMRVLTYTPMDYNASVGELAGSDAPVEYFDLAGARVSGSEPGIYVRRQGADVRKVVVK